MRSCVSVCARVYFRSVAMHTFLADEQTGEKRRKREEEVVVDWLGGFFYVWVWGER